MPETASNKPKQPASKDAGDAAGDVQEQVDEMNEKGYLGETVDMVDNEVYSLTTGPDGPTLPDDRTPVDQPVLGAPKPKPKS